MLHITRCPHRITLAGGGTDYEEFYSEHGAILIGMAINQYSYIAAREYPEIFPYKYHIQYSETEKVNHIDDIRHDGIRGTLQFLDKSQDIPERLEIIHMADLPRRCGTGSSSAMIAALLKSLYQSSCYVQSTDTILADMVNTVERNILKEPGGYADPIWGCWQESPFSYITFNKAGRFSIKPMPVSLDFTDDLMSRIFLVYTGSNKQSFDIATSHQTGKDSIKLEMMHIAHEMLSEFKAENISNITRLMAKTWEAKKRLSPRISNENVDNMIIRLAKYGSLASRLMGSGEAGFILSIAGNPDVFRHHLERNNIKYIKVELDRYGVSTV